MTFIEIFEHILYGHEFDTQKVENLIEKIADIQTSGCTNIIEIAKWRDKGAAMGKIVKLWFEIESNRLKSDPYEVMTFNWQEQATQANLDGIGDMPNYEIDGFPFTPTAEDEVPPF